MDFLGLPKSEIVIMSTWDINGGYDNGVCGHLYEVIEYYWLMANSVNDSGCVSFIFPENIDIDLVLNKYNFTRYEKDTIKKAARPRPKNGIVNTIGGNGLVLIVDGNLGNFKGIIRGIPVQFACGKDGLLPSQKQHPYISKWYLLADERLYPNGLNIDFTDDQILPYKTFNYNKKILFSRMNKEEIMNSNYISNRPQSNARKYSKVLMYLTKNCRYQSEEDIVKIFKRNIRQRFGEYDLFSDLLLVSDYDIDISKIKSLLPSENKVEYLDLRSGPVNLFKLNWTFYLYTPLERQWDCSNRLIAESSFFERYWGIDEFKGYDDLALNIRIEDSHRFIKDMRKEGNYPTIQNSTGSLLYPGHPFNILNLGLRDNIINILADIWVENNYANN